MYYFTADEHFGHENILGYCDRPFENADEMDNAIIERFNFVVKPTDTTIHAGDFTLKGKETAENYIRRLNGKHIFLKGSHEYWNRELPSILERHFNKIFIVVCHYAMRRWARSYHGSIQLYGHSHGKLRPEKNQMDIGVDTNNFYPYSLEDIKRKLLNNKK